MYFRAGKIGQPELGNGINVPENYSGSTFNGGLIGPEYAEYTENLSDAADAQPCLVPQDAPEPQAEAEKMSCSIPPHISSEKEGKKRRGEGLSAVVDSFLGSEELLIIGMIFLIYNGTLDEDILTLLILLLF